MNILSTGDITVKFVVHHGFKRRLNNAKKTNDSLQGFSVKENGYYLLQGRSYVSTIAVGLCLSGMGIIGVARYLKTEQRSTI